MSVSLAGNRVAVGAIFATHTEGRQNLGQVRVFEYEPRRDLWIQAGETIYGDNEGDHVRGWSYASLQRTTRRYVEGNGFGVCASGGDGQANNGMSIIMTRKNRV